MENSPQAPLVPPDPPLTRDVDFYTTLQDDVGMAVHVHVAGTATTDGTLTIDTVQVVMQGRESGNLRDWLSTRALIDLAEFGRFSALDTGAYVHRTNHAPADPDPIYTKEDIEWIEF